MKSTLRYISLFCILITIPLVVMWATWEGNAGTGVPSDFPGSGLYARSDMFPRNTLVNIVNLETGNSVRAVITGSSGVPGLVAVLSPETAAALAIREGAVVRVRITTPPPVSEQPAPGTLETKNAVNVDDPDMNPEALVPLAAIASASESPLVPIPGTEAPETFDEARDSLALGDEALPMESDTTMMDDPLPMDADPIPEEAGDKADGILASEEAPVPEQPEQDLFYEEPELVAAADSDGQMVEAVTLEPAELRPPEADAATIPVVPPVGTVPATDVDTDTQILPETPVEEKPVFAAVSLLDENPVERAPLTEMDSSGSDFPWIDRLESGAYYVQVAAYHDTVNVRSILNRFGKKYPVVVQKSGTPENPLVKVFVGPLKKDEYGAVLEYFRMNGFDDAFVKKLP